MTCASAVSMPIESWPKMTTRRPLSACVVTAAAAQSTSASAVPSVICGFRPVSGQVPTLRCDSLPYCAIAPLTACAKTTPGLGPLLPQVKLIGVSFGNCCSSEITLSCGNAQVSGAQTSTLTPASWNCLATMSACGSPSTRIGAQTTFAGEPSGSLTRVGQHIGHHLADVAAALAAVRVDARVARDEDADGRRVALVCFRRYLRVRLLFP